MTTSTILNNVSVEDINALFKALQDQLNEIKLKFEPKAPVEYLTRHEVAQMLKCDLSTIHNWTKKGKLMPYGIGNRVYYKRSQIEDVLIPIKNNTHEK